MSDDKEVRSRRDRPTNSTHFGDTDFYEENAEDIADATWGEVYQACCCHTPKEWMYIFVGFVFVCFFLYFFLFGLELLGGSAKVMTGCAAGSLFGDETNPIAALMIGILATVLLQSSSTTTSIIVSLVGSGTIPTRQAIYMIMGANIGTSVTNTIVAVGQMGDGDQLERAFAGATVHDMFNFMTVSILLPIEVASGYLFHLTKAIVSDDAVKDGEKWEGPIKKIVSPLANKVIIANKKLITGVAKGDSCDSFYPIECIDPDAPTKTTCSKVGLIACDKKTGDCPIFFQPEADRKDDEVSGGVCFFVALVILVSCLIGLVTILQKMLMGMSTRIIFKATNVNGYLAILIGVGLTILVQSSSITTSTLTPLVGMGVLQLEQMFPLTLGANIGTTVTAILAALVSDKVESLQVALAHLFFNISGIIIFFPIPFMRRIPLHAARQLGRATRLWRGFPIVYIAIIFFAVPLLLLGLATLFEQDTKGFTTLGSVLVVIIVFVIMYFIYWWNFQQGKESAILCMGERQRRNVAMNSLADDMEFLKARIAALSEHTGLPDNDDDNDGVEDDDVEKNGNEKAVEIKASEEEEEVPPREQ